MSTARVVLASVLNLLLLAPSLPLWAAGTVDAVAESRYVLQRVDASRVQKDVLQSIVRETIPNQITSVGAALQYLLEPYGYQLDDRGDKSGSLNFYVLLTRPLPKPHRTLNPVTLYDALDILGGESFEVVINPVLRTVRYRLKPAFQDYVGGVDLDKARALWQQHIRPVSSHEPATLSDNMFDYGLVKPGDTLSDIVLRLNLPNLTLDQALVHTFRSNPSAFAQSNMNHLLVGEYLSVPPQVDKPLSPDAASRLVDKHYSRWLQKVQP